MSRLLFYNLIAGTIALAVVQSLAWLAALAPDFESRRTAWEKAPVTASVIEWMGPARLQAYLVCAVIDLSGLAASDKSAGP
jgi:hypothetical protein